MAVTRTHPAFFGDHNGHGFVHHFDFGDGFFLLLDQCAARIRKSLSIRLDFFDDQAAQGSGVTDNLFELGFFFA